LNTIQQLRGGLGKAIEEVDSYIASATERGALTGYLRASRGTLSQLLLMVDRTDSSPFDPAPNPDTARLEFLMAQYNMTRESIDAWRDSSAKPAPKYRPWTAAEAAGKVFRYKGHDEWHVILRAFRTAAYTHNHCIYLTALPTEAVQPDGSPCGVLVEGK
jgi:hypothetical protein